jgi:hypothetical protein
MLVPPETVVGHHQSYFLAFTALVLSLNSHSLVELQPYA